MAFSTRDGRTRDRSAPVHLTRILGLAAALFLFSVLDPVALVALDLCALFLFLSTEPVPRGMGLIGIIAVTWIAQAGQEGITPVLPAILVSSMAFAAILRFGRFDSALRPAVAAALAALALVSAGFALLDPGGLTGWIDGLSGMLTEAMDASFRHLQAMNVFAVDELVEFRRAMDGTVEFMVALVPGAAFINLVLANVLGVRIFGLLHRGGRPLPPSRPLTAFSFSDGLVWGLIAGLLPAILPLPAVAGTLLLNVLMVVVCLYLLRGLAVGVFWLRGKGFSTFMIGAMYLFLFFVLPPAFLAGLFLPGLLDTWFDFRSLGGS
jgi:hypothetical protein